MNEETLLALLERSIYSRLSVIAVNNKLLLKKADFGQFF